LPLFQYNYFKLCTFSWQSLFKVFAISFLYVISFYYISTVIKAHNLIMVEQLKEIEEQLGEIVVSLRMEQLYVDNPSGYLLNKGTPAADLLLNSTASEREFILHKLAPELTVEDVYEANHIILKLNAN